MVALFACELDSVPDLFDVRHIHVWQWVGHKLLRTRDNLIWPWGVYTLLETRPVWLHYLHVN